MIDVISPYVGLLLLSIFGLFLIIGLLVSENEEKASKKGRANTH